MHTKSRFSGISIVVTFHAASARSLSRPSPILPPDGVQHVRQSRPSLRQLLLNRCLRRRDVSIAQLLVEFEHPVRDMVVGSTGFHFFGLLDGHLDRQAPVRDALGDSMALPHPSIDVHRLRLPDGNLRLESVLQFVCHLLRRLSPCEVLDDSRVPYCVEIWPVGSPFRVRFLGGTALERDRDAIPAQIIVRRRVQRLVHVADEMDYVSKCVGSLLSGCVRIPKHSELGSDGARDASCLRRAILRYVALRHSKRNINEVPATSLWLHAALIVGPRRGVG